MNSYSHAQSPPAPPVQASMEKSEETVPVEASMENAEETLPLAPTKMETVIDRHSVFSSTADRDHGPRKILMEPLKPLTGGTNDDPGSPTSPKRAKPAPSPRSSTGKAHETSVQISEKSFNSTAQSFRSVKSTATNATATSSRGHRTLDAIEASLRPHTSGGVSIRLPALHRTDCFPCPHSGRRHISATDNQIRIFLLLPGNGHRVALWVNPMLPLGPKRFLKDSFHLLWGQDAEEVGPFGTKNKAPEKGVPMNPHLKQIKSERDQEDSITVSVGLSPRKVKKERQISMDMEVQNLKHLIQNTTGIAIADQIIIFAGRRLSDDEKTIADYGIGQGGLVIVEEEKKLKDQSHVELATTHAREKLFQYDPKGLIRGKLGSLANSLQGTTRSDKAGTIKARVMLKPNFT